MLTEGVKSTFKDAAKELTGSRKRDFMAKVTEDSQFKFEVQHLKIFA